MATLWYKVVALVEFDTKNGKLDGLMYDRIKKLLEGGLPCGVISVACNLLGNNPERVAKALMREEGLPDD